MQHGRRTTDRRRRVLYTSHHADTTTPTAASRREAEKLREARRPTAAYGSRVNRRLRGRWFSLVPVKRRTLTIASVIIVGVSLVLCLAHYWAVTKNWLAYRPEIARPLRLDRPDSFGRWITIVLLAGSSGAALLIYQLRRYRNDDYRGQYRLWRMVLILLMVASVHALVGLIDWAGAILDAALGKRMALTGSDWMRLVAGIGGAIMALRVVAEIRRSRWSLAWMIGAAALFAIPEAANWNLLMPDSVGKWMLVTTAPLLGTTALFLALVGYLRVLFREVRNIQDEETIAERFQQFRARIFSGEREEDVYEEEELQPRRRWWAFGSRRRQDELSDLDAEDEYEEEEDDGYEYEDEEEWEDESDDEEAVAEDSDEGADEEELAPRRKRRWFGLRAAKQEPTEEELLEQDAEADQQVDEPEPTPKKRKKRRWSLRLDPAGSSDTEEEEPEASEPEEAEAKPKRRFGLSWRRKPQQQNEDSEAESVQEEQWSPEPVEEDEPEEDLIDPNEIDWNSLSKSERRRLRKKLKRQGRAA